MIHDTKPAECSDYNCAYAQMEGLSDQLRPDNCGIIFEKVNDRLFFGTLIPGKTVSAIGRQQLDAFQEQGYSVVLASPSERDNLYLCHPAHDEGEIRREMMESANGYIQH